MTFKCKSHSFWGVERDSTQNVCNNQLAHGDISPLPRVTHTVRAVYHFLMSVSQHCFCFPSWSRPDTNIESLWIYSYLPITRKGSHLIANPDDQSQLKGEIEKDVGSSTALWGYWLTCPTHEMSPYLNEFDYIWGFH